MRTTVGYGDPARGQARKKWRSRATSQGRQGLAGNLEERASGGHAPFRSNLKYFRVTVSVAGPQPGITLIATLERFVVYRSWELIISGRAPGCGPEGTGYCSSCYRGNFRRITEARPRRSWLGSGPSFPVTKKTQCSLHFEKGRR